MRSSAAAALMGHSRRDHVGVFPQTPTARSIYLSYTEYDDPLEELGMIWRKALTRAALVFALAGALQGCSSLEEMGRQQDQYNRNRCHDQFGLIVGSSEYARCVSMGANAYADAQKNAAVSPGAVVTPGVVVSPAGGTVIIAPGAPAQNNSCKAPASAPKGQCSSCAVSCGAKQASCTPGEEWPDGSSCLKSAVCECR
jgi:hypothetical protein